MKNKNKDTSFPRRQAGGQARSALVNRQGGMLRHLAVAAVVILGFAMEPGVFAQTGSAEDETPEDATLQMQMQMQTERSFFSVDFSPLLQYQGLEDYRYGQAVGPFFELLIPRHPPDHSLAAMPRPLFTTFRHHHLGTEGWDALWPLAASRNKIDGHYTYVLNFIHTRKPAGDTRPRTRWWLWPLVFIGRDNQGEPYAALFPVGGRIANLWVDEARFLLFPLYLQTRQGELVSDSLLWPVLSRSESPTVSKWRVFPVYGVSHGEHTVSRFILWPILHTASTESGQFGPNGFFVFPFYGDIRHYSRNDELLAHSRTALWPFFKYETGPMQRKLHMPWPFYQAEDITRPGYQTRQRYYWPLYGYRGRPQSEYRFLLWPVLHHRVAVGPERKTTMHWVAPVWQQTRHVNRETEETEFVSRSLWPLFRQQRSPQRHEVNVFNLWPTAITPAIERNYAPLWRIYQYSATPDSSRQQLLWGLWKRSRTEDGSRHRLFPLFDYQRKADENVRVSLLTGLLGWENREKEGGRLRFLWVF